MKHEILKMTMYISSATGDKRGMTFIMKNTLHAWLADLHESLGGYE